MSDGVNKSGTLFIVPTPIGNLEDITLRALRILRQVPIVACEDTRVTGRLLAHFEIPAPRLLSLFARNEQERIGSIVDALRRGDDVALVSDAGTPGISDPGSRLIATIVEQGLRVEPLPGPTAFIAALVASGMRTDSVVFEGFLPHKKGRRTMLERLVREERTIVLYESPHRILRLLSEIVEHFGADRRVVVAREVSKLYEEFSRGTAGELLEGFTARSTIKGEITVVIEGAQ